MPPFCCIKPPLTGISYHQNATMTVQETYSWSTQKQTASSDISDNDFPPLVSDATVPDGYATRRRRTLIGSVPVNSRLLPIQWTSRNQLNIRWSWTRDQWEFLLDSGETSTHDSLQTTAVQTAPSKTTCNVEHTRCSYKQGNFTVLSQNITTVLGPLLYVLYTAALEQIVARHDQRLHM